jgi:hypothetical protein
MISKRTGNDMQRQRTGKHWSPQDDKKLSEVFPRTETKELEEVFNCSRKVIQTRARRLGIKKDPDWEKEFRIKTAKERFENYGDNLFCNWKKDEHRPKKDSILTKHGFQTVQVVPAGRIIAHRISDFSVRTRCPKSADGDAPSAVKSWPTQNY